MNIWLQPLSKDGIISYMIGYLDPPLKGPGIQGPSQIEMPKCQKGKKSGLKIKERLHLVIQQDGNLNSILNVQTCKKGDKKHDKYISKETFLFFSVSPPYNYNSTTRFRPSAILKLQISFILIFLFILYTYLLIVVLN